MINWFRDRWRAHYIVSDDNGLSGRTATRRVALRYARNRATLGHASVVTRVSRRGVMHVVATFPSRRP